jgi:hypothetical protein
VKIRADVDVNPNCYLPRFLASTVTTSEGASSSSSSALDNERASFAALPAASRLINDDDGSKLEVKEPFTQMTFTELVTEAIMVYI